MAGEEVAKKYQTLIFLAGSASAEFFADIALCPFEAVKVRRGVCFFPWYTLVLTHCLMRQLPVGLPASCLVALCSTQQLVAVFSGRCMLHQPRIVAGTAFTHRLHHNHRD